MNHICAECGFSKTCTEDEFMEHIMLHDAMDDMFEEMGIVQEQAWSVRAEGDKVVVEIPSW